MPSPSGTVHSRRCSKENLPSCLARPPVIEKVDVMAAKLADFGCMKFTAKPALSWDQLGQIAANGKSGGFMAKTKKPKKQTAARKPPKVKDSVGISGSQTHQPFEQDAKRRIGQYGGAGEPPIMK